MAQSIKVLRAEIEAANQSAWRWQFHAITIAEGHKPAATRAINWDGCKIKLELYRPERADNGYIIVTHYDDNQGVNSMQLVRTLDAPTNDFNTALRTKLSYAFGELQSIAMHTQTVKI